MALHYGLKFEEGLVDGLRALGCVVTTCDRWDYREKVDMIVTKIAGRRPRFPIEVQVTLRFRDVAKLERYLLTRRPNAAVTSVYVEANGGLSPEAAAQALLAALNDMQGLKTRARGVFSVRLHQNGSWRWNEAHERLAYLRRARPTTGPHRG